MKLKKITAAIFALVLCFACTICAFAAEPNIEDQTEDAFMPYNATAVSDETQNDEDVILWEDEESTVPEEQPIEETTTEIETETTTEPTTIKKVIDKNKATIYFKDVGISCNVVIKNIKSGKKTEFEISSDNNWTYSGDLPAGEYEIVSVKPITSQYKIKSVMDASGNEISSFKLIDTGEGIQVVNIYLKQRVTTGLLAFIKKHIFFDVCVVLLAILYIVNAKGYRIPILSNWVDNYRN